ncbi:DUF3995 domain-containing protein [Modestobacter italicus]|uniref:DUF3995 domain-containing protein n=1 Tax=Modestobacter italicus (strain DSM 44449 / CECT 9708 / BC 501) TaxID=2732864 RepID=UPI001FE87039|nr:DUF3995 domain-containing protein [Modestobacter italicus]
MRWGWVAAGWAAAFAVLHVFWALGGSVGLASSAGDRLAAERPGWFVAGGLWGVAALLLIAAGLAVALARGRRRRLLVLAGAAIGLLLLLRGLGIEMLLLAGAYAGNAAMSDAQRHWSLVLWNPWFLLGGMAFLLAARSTARSTTDTTPA